MGKILDDLITNNEYPIIFIGSGISKRYLEDFPSWVALLEEFWTKLGRDNFYGELNKIRDSIKHESPDFSERELHHYSLIKMGSLLAKSFDSEFNNGRVTIEGFTAFDAYSSNVSPFKKAITDRLSSYSHRQGLEDELESFKKMLLKTQIILTTNYDTFIEDSYNRGRNRIVKYIGQKGFFRQTMGSAELYKLHGCVESPEDIIITEKDYETFEKNSVLISARIISMMMHSPIIFLGYSLTDVNVRNMIRDFTSSLTDDELTILEKRLIVIEWKENEDELLESVIDDRDLGCKINVIKTDNYREVFDRISLINQGVAPIEIRRFNSIFKQIVIDRGKKGALNSVLIAPNGIDQLEEGLLTKNIAIAFGDSKHIFQIPDIVSYCIDYISDKNEISTDIRMRFAAIQQGNARFPVNKLLTEDLLKNNNLHPTEREKLRQRRDRYSDFDLHYSTINKHSVLSKSCSVIDDIKKMDAKKSKIYETISYNIKSIDLADVKEYLLSELADLKKQGEITIDTELRRLMLLYDILQNKEDYAEPLV